MKRDLTKTKEAKQYASSLFYLHTICCLSVAWWVVRFYDNLLYPPYSNLKKTLVGYLTNSLCYVCCIISLNS